MDLSELSQNEREAFELYKQRYREQHPPPRFRGAVGLDWRFFAILATSIGALGLATLRTMDIFYEAALLSGNPYLAIAEAFFVILAIEGGIVVWSAVRASKRQNTSDAKLGFGILMAVLISVFAGLGQSLHLIENIDPTVLRYFQYALTIIIGVGASLVAWIGGDVLGEQVAQAGERREDASLSHRERMREYQNKLLASWQRSAERKMVRGDLSAEVSRTASSTAVQEPVQEGTTRYMTDDVYEWLSWQNNGWSREDDVPSAREIEKAISVPVSSAQRGRKRWIRENL